MNNNKKILRLVRVPYGKESTPANLREYTIKGVPNCPVGTLDEWKKWAKENGYGAVDVIEIRYAISAEQIAERRCGDGIITNNSI
jgi:hypothetical protein